MSPSVYNTDCTNVIGPFEHVSIAFISDIKTVDQYYCDHVT